MIDLFGLMNVKWCINGAQARCVLALLGKAG